MKVSWCCKKEGFKRFVRTKDDVDLVHHVLQAVERRRRVEDEARLAARAAVKLSERSMWVVASGWKVMKSAPASAKSPIMPSTGVTIRCTSIGALMPSAREEKV